MKIRFKTTKLIILTILFGLVAGWFSFLPVMITLDQFFVFNENSNQNFETSFAEGTGGFNLNLYITHENQEFYTAILTYNVYASGNVSCLGFYTINIRLTSESVFYGLIAHDSETRYYDLESNDVFSFDGLPIWHGDVLIMEGNVNMSFNNKGIIQNETITYEHNYTLLSSGRQNELIRDVSIAFIWIFYFASFGLVIFGIFKTLSLVDPKTRALIEKKRQEKDFISYLKKKKEEENA